jgi:hypothetical protein
MIEGLAVRQALLFKQAEIRLLLSVEKAERYDRPVYLFPDLNTH